VRARGKKRTAGKLAKISPQVAAAARLVKRLAGGAQGHQVVDAVRGGHKKKQRPKGPSGDRERRESRRGPRERGWVPMCTESTVYATEGVEKKRLDAQPK